MHRLRVIHLPANYDETIANGILPALPNVRVRCALAHKRRAAPTAAGAADAVGRLSLIHI